MVKPIPANIGDAGDMSLIPGLGRYPSGGNDSPLQYSFPQSVACLLLFLIPSFAEQKFLILMKPYLSGISWVVSLVLYQIHLVFSDVFF